MTKSVKKIGPIAMRDIYLRAAQLCFGNITGPKSAAGTYGCLAIEEAIVDRFPWVFDDPDLQARLARTLCSLFVDHFRNEAPEWEEKRVSVGEFGDSSDTSNQLHRVTALCLMADFVSNYADGVGVPPVERAFI